MCVLASIQAQFKLLVLVLIFFTVTICFIDPICLSKSPVPFIIFGHTHCVEKPILLCLHPFTVVATILVSFM